MKTAKLAAAILMVITAAIALQGPQPIPPHEGEDHQGQPEFCINVDTKEWIHNCDCMPSMGDPECENKPPARGPKDQGRYRYPQGQGGESSKCQVYCRKDKCRCETKCGKTLNDKRRNRQPNRDALYF